MHSRDLMVGDVQATETNYTDFASSASAKELRIVTAQGASPSGKTPFKVLQKKKDGTVKISRTIKPDEIESIGASVYVAETQTQYVFSSITAPTAGDKIVLQLRVYNAGSVSDNQWMNFFGEYIAKTGDDAEDVVDGIIASVNNSFLQYPGSTSTSNPLFTLTKGGSGAAATLTVVAKEQSLDLGLKDGRRIEYDASFYKLDNNNNGRVDIATETKTGGKDGNGTLKQVQRIEFFSRGNYGDQYGNMGWPNVFSGSTRVEADVTEGYHMIDIMYRHKGGTFTDHGVLGQITIAVANVDQDGGGAGTVFTEVNKIINVLETVTGFTIADLS